MEYTREYVENLFEYHPANEYSAPIHDGVRSEFRTLALYLYDTLPEGPDRTYAIRQLQVAMWAANSAVAIAPQPQYA